MIRDVKGTIEREGAEFGLFITLEDRFFATLFAAYGVALLWCIKDIERKSTVVYFLAATFFVGGLARLVSVAAVGLPSTFFVAMTVLELLIPFFMVFMQARIARAPGA